MRAIGRFAVSAATRSPGSKIGNSPLDSIKSTVVVLHNAHITPVLHLGMKGVSPLVLASLGRVRWLSGRRFWRLASFCPV